MKVRLALTIDVDPQAWMDAYDVERPELRKDIRDHMQHVVTAWIEDQGFAPG